MLALSHSQHTLLNKFETKAKEKKENNGKQNICTLHWK